MTVMKNYFEGLFIVIAGCPYLRALFVCTFMLETVIVFGSLQAIVR